MRQSPTRNLRALRLAVALAAAPAALVAVGASGGVQAQAGYPSGYPVQQAPRQDPAAEAWAQILAKTSQSNDAALNQRVRAVGDRLVRAAGADPRGWDYRVFNDNSPNAFVLPGGRVGVNTGLFRVIQNDDQLAAVLGHEIAHNQFNHAAQRSTRTGLAQLGLSLGARLFGRGDPELANRIARYGGAGAQLGILLPFSRKQELEADRLGVDYMARAGFRPSEAVSLWRNFQNARAASAPQFLSTHPNDATRIQQLEAYNRTRGYN
jgi:predicted Zn-dependent protease